MVSKVSYDDVTESHLSKKFNDILYDAMMRVNVTGYIIESEPHVNNLRPYFAATYVLYRNTFMLFYNISMHGEDGKDLNLAKLLINKMRSIQGEMRELRRDKTKMNSENFEKIVQECDYVHMLIMDGLQKRHMLVRLSQNEPRGEETVFYWEDKAAFRKGGVNLPKYMDEKQIKQDFFNKK